MKVYAGPPAAARQYLEADRGRADDYYLAEGTGLARHFTARDGRVHIENMAGTIRVIGWARDEVAVTGTLGSGAGDLGCSHRWWTRVACRCRDVRDAVA